MPRRQRKLFHFISYFYWLIICFRSKEDKLGSRFPYDWTRSVHSVNSSTLWNCSVNIETRQTSREHSSSSNSRHTIYWTWWHLLFIPWLVAPKKFVRKATEQWRQRGAHSKPVTDDISVKITMLVCRPFIVIVFRKLFAYQRVQSGWTHSEQHTLWHYLDFTLESATQNKI